MKRATAGVSYFRVHTSPQLSNDNPEAKENEKELEEEGIRSAKSTLAEISQDNVKFRESNTVFEKWFDVQLRSELVPMLQETHLVFVDIPGINEANTEQKYKDYVTKNWNTFDVAVVVMDAKQGVNTEDSVFLLNLVKQNNETKKDIPVIILCNKVDDPDDEEQAEMVAEARREVEKIFNVPCREKALKKITGNPTKKCDENLSPVFIPISAIHAYINQCASLMSRKSFEEFDPDLLEKIGREQIGRRNWNKLSKEQKLDSVHELIQENYQEGLKIAILTRCSKHSRTTWEVNQNRCKSLKCKSRRHCALFPMTPYPERFPQLSSKCMIPAKFSHAFPKLTTLCAKS
jgi:GTPase SAR1 family protein